MKFYFYRISIAFLILSMTLSSCDISLVTKQVNVSIVYGSEKQAWLDPLVAQYNAEKHTTSDGSEIVVSATPLGSIESINGILDGSLQPVVWSPASSIYIPVANEDWRKNHNSDLINGTPKDLLLSPVVIAMWKPMAEALGWPGKPLGWADIAKLATSDQGWAAYGHPEWGQFKFGHTHPDFSNSGIVSIIAEAYAGAGKQRGLTLGDLQSPDLQNFMANVESSVIHYGSSTGFFADRMFSRGPSYLSAAVMYENLVVNQESQRLSGQSQQVPVVAIYPSEGTFWADHPYIILDAPWVTDIQKAAAQDFESFLLDKPQQQKALELGFRPSDPSIALSSPLDAQHGADISQPKTVLEIPSPQVLEGIRTLWQKVKKPVDIVVVMDISGSMQGDKINSARASLIQFIGKLDDRDRLKIVTFSDDITTITPLTPVGGKRQAVIDSVSGIFENGNTRLYDAVDSNYQNLLQEGDPKHIRAMVVLTDGLDTESKLTLDQVLADINSSSQEGGNAIKLFTIAFGSDADKVTLQKIADASGGEEYDSSPTTIQQIYDDIATFF
ncbi:MAG: VWA domain-containing protein [Anaerolineales bacterium]